MNVFIVYWHPEPKSFNHAMFVQACQTLADAGADVRTSDLHAMAFDPVSGHSNFQTTKDPDFLKLQLEELYARGMLQFVGFDVLAPYIVYGPARMSDAQRSAELARFGDRLRRIAGERPIEVGRY